VTGAIAKPTPEVDAARDRVAAAAAALVETKTTVGVGTGDTARRFTEALARRVKDEGLQIRCVPTSEAAAALCRSLGLALRPLADVERLALAVDGADEVDPRLELIKGGGGAHTREKIVAASADRFVVVVDETKLVDVLGAESPVPIEVVPEAIRLVHRRLADLGAQAEPRLSASEEGPWVTDLGNRILDARFPGIPDPRALAAALDGIPGVIEHGLFVGMTHLVLVGELESQVVRRLNPSSGGAR
jgi:ribose 5-phosphate isomerase A